MNKGNFFLLIEHPPYSGFLNIIMIKNNTITFSFQTYEGIMELEGKWQNLLNEARKACQLSYAPYSKFKVGAALLLRNNEIICGANQENVSFPAGICAERTAISAASSIYPNEEILGIAISYETENPNETSQLMLSPCGICRQTILERANLQINPIVMLMSSDSGEVILLDDARNLLPFAFSSFRK